jgi:hypothetical protein
MEEVVLETPLRPVGDATRMELPFDTYTLRPYKTNKPSRIETAMTDPPPHKYILVSHTKSNLPTILIYRDREHLIT